MPATKKKEKKKSHRFLRRGKTENGPELVILTYTFVEFVYINKDKRFPFIFYITYKKNIVLENTPNLNFP